jgi:hypothetical protein
MPKLKVKFLLKQTMKTKRGVERYSVTNSLTSALDEVGG